MAPDSRLAGRTWDKSLLRNTRCPFLRAAASAGKLDIKNDQNLQKKDVLVATVASVKSAGIGLGDVLVFFARLNHTRGLRQEPMNLIERFRQTEFNMDQSNVDNISDGTHGGSVNIICGPTGEFNPEVMEEIGKIAGGSRVLTPELMARVIVAANHTGLSKDCPDSRGEVIDLAKSAGEWGLMFCLLQDGDGDVPIDDLESLCKNQVIPPRGQQNLGKSSTREWIHYTTVITAHIAKGQPDAAAGNQVAGCMHDLWCEEKGGPGCGCATCAKPGFWDSPGPAIRNAIDSLGAGLSGWFRFH